MEITQYTTELEQFRLTLYQNFTNRADTVMELVDAISSKADAQAVVEYSLAPSFRRSYSTLFKAINKVRLEPLVLAHTVAPYLPQPKQWPFWLLMVDVTPYPRPYAKTLEDRGMVYQPEVVKGKLPVTIGHQYSTVALGLEAESGLSGSWVLPLATERVATTQDKEGVGMDQISRLLTDEKLPFGQALTVEVADSSYSKVAYLHGHRQHDNLVTIVRVRGTRTFYQPPSPAIAAPDGARRGHPRWYGARFALADATTWPTPDATYTHQETSRRGKPYRVEVQAWHSLLMRGETQPTKAPMHEHPFTLVHIVRYDQAGNPAFKHPLWLIVMGQRRGALTLAQMVEAYATRFDLEHFFRFGKQKMLLVAFETPAVAREETWWQLVHISYAQLWLARHLTTLLPRPWERNLPAIRQRLISPSLVQRDFGRIIRQLGTPAQPPKPRGYSPGRRQGLKLPKRPRQKVVVKSQMAAKPP